MTPTHHTPLSFVQLLVMACCSCGAITNASAAMTATRAHRFGNTMAGPSSSFWKASSARLVGDSMRVRPWNPPSGPRPLLDDYAGTMEEMRQPLEAVRDDQQSTEHESVFRANLADEDAFNEWMEAYSVRSNTCLARPECWGKEHAAKAVHGGKRGSL
ncbi:hypothetical protein MRX96_012116 [Rhipicephalus microplus]